MSPKIILTILIAVSIGLHLYRINIPSFPVFDEMHYTTYASRYADGKPHVDVHPPLGKLVYAIPLLFLKDTKDTNTAFIEQIYDKDKDTIKPIQNFGDYGDFPYVLLRLISVAFGVLLPLLVYFFIRAITASELSALLGAFFITFENMLLLESRLILLNPMFLTLGMALLVAMVCKKPKPILGGILFGLAMNVKWIALVFLGPLVILFLFTRSRGSTPREVGLPKHCVNPLEVRPTHIESVGQKLTSIFRTSNVPRGSTSRILASNVKEVEPRNIELTSQRSMVNGQKLIVFFVVAILTFLIVQIGVQSIFVSAKDRTMYYESFIPWLPKTTPEQNSVFLTTKAFFVEFNIMAAGYTTGIKPDPFLSSEWFLWPFMGTPMTYTLTAPFIILMGNPFVWLAGTAAVVMMLFAIFRGSISQILTLNKKKEIEPRNIESIGQMSDVRCQMSDVKYRPYFIFLFSYIFALLPFMLVNRATFLYHYSPALIFSTCLAALFFRDIIRGSTSKTLTSNREEVEPRNIESISQWSNAKGQLFIIILLTLLGFALSVPYTYGVQ